MFDSFCEFSLDLCEGLQTPDNSVRQQAETMYTSSENDVNFVELVAWFTSQTKAECKDLGKLFICFPTAE